MSAGIRGDAAERERLVNAAGTITLTMQDYRPVAVAFRKLANLLFLELLDCAARYREAFRFADDGELFDGEGDDGCFRLALAYGFELKTRMHSWGLFCERRGLP